MSFLGQGRGREKRYSQPADGSFAYKDQEMVLLGKANLNAVGCHRTQKAPSF
jgi:hypothetical protein